MPKIRAHRDPKPENVLRAIQARGVDSATWLERASDPSELGMDVLAGSIRFAAHEAHHAIMAGLTDESDRWDSDSIHEALLEWADERPAKLVATELDARAVERVVCDRLGLDPGPIEHWAHITFMETLQTTRIALPSGDWVADCIRDRIGRRSIYEAATTIIELGRAVVSPKPDSLSSRGRRGRLLRTPTRRTRGASSDDQKKGAR